MYVFPLRTKYKPWFFKRKKSSTFGDNLFLPFQTNQQGDLGLLDEQKLFCDKQTWGE